MPHHRRRRDVIALALALFVIAVLGACGSSTPRATPATSPPSSSVSSPTTGPGATSLTLTEKNKGATVAAHVGDRAQVALASTYWTIGAGSNPAVLRLDGPPVIAPDLRGCVPGQGCGTATATFTAISAGTATVTATRTSCGEAMGCTAANGTYTVTINVN